MQMSLAHINWLLPNLGGRNDLASVFHQTFILVKGVGGAKLTHLLHAALQHN